MSVELETSELRKIERFAKANGLTNGEVVALAGRRLLEERRNSGLCVLCDGGEMSTFRFTKAQVEQLDIVCSSLGTGPAQLVASLALGLLDQADPEPEGAGENVALFRRHLNRFGFRGAIPTLPALSGAVSGPFSGVRTAKARLDMGRNTLRRITAVAKAQGMTPEAWIQDRLRKVANEPSTRQSPPQDPACLNIRKSIILRVHNVAKTCGRKADSWANEALNEALFNYAFECLVEDADEADATQGKGGRS